METYHAVDGFTNHYRKQVDLHFIKGRVTGRWLENCDA